MWVFPLCVVQQQWIDRHRKVQHNQQLLQRLIKGRWPQPDRDCSTSLLSGAVVVNTANRDTREENWSSDRGNTISPGNSDCLLERSVWCEISNGRQSFSRPVEGGVCFGRWRVTSLLCIWKSTFWSDELSQQSWQSDWDDDEGCWRSCTHSHCVEKYAATPVIAAFWH